jgi:lysophospholipase L1-like esterase
MNKRIAAGVGSVLRSTWLLVGGVLVCLVLIEACASVCVSLGLGSTSRFDEETSDVLRDVDWIPDYVSEVARSRASRWQPYVYWRRQPFAGQYINIDDDGLRRTWSPGSEGRESVRIFMFGGSTLWGRGARDEFTVPSLVARRLAEEAEGAFAVTNFGEAGYVNTQEMIALTLELRDGNVPDIVVFYDGANDVFAAYQAHEAGVPQNEFRRRLDFESFETAFALRVANRLSSVALLRRLFGSPADSAVWSRLGLTDVETRELAGATVSKYKGNLRQINALADAHGFQVLYFWQPVIWTKAPPTAHEEKILERFAPLQPLYRESYRLIARDVQLEGDERFHDISSVLNETSESFFFDYGHMTEAGNARVAAEVTSAILRLSPGGDGK